MSYFSPPLQAQVNIVHAVGLVRGTLVAAPGAGTAIRVVAWSWGISRTTTGIVDLILQEGAGAVDIISGLGMQLTGTANNYGQLPAPGWQLAEDTSLQVETRSTAATGFTIATAFYYLDDVS